MLLSLSLSLSLKGVTSIAIRDLFEEIVEALKISIELSRSSSSDLHRQNVIMRAKGSRLGAIDIVTPGACDIQFATDINRFLSFWSFLFISLSLASRSLFSLFARLLDSHSHPFCFISQVEGWLMGTDQFGGTHTRPELWFMDALASSRRCIAQTSRCDLLSFWEFMPLFWSSMFGGDIHCECRCWGNGGIH